MSRLLKTRGRVFNSAVNRFDTGTAGIAERCTKDKTKNTIEIQNNEPNLMKLQNQNVLHLNLGA